MKTSFAGKFFPLAVLFLIAGSIAGCKSTPKVDWDGRVSSYTYDQAVTDLGPPNTRAKLTNGYTIAEWITKRSSGSGFSFGIGYISGSGGTATSVGIGPGVGFDNDDQTLQLTFNTNNVLTAWSKN
jgi:hypothetical protein